MGVGALTRQESIPSLGQRCAKQTMGLNALRARATSSMNQHTVAGKQLRVQIGLAVAGDESEGRFAPGKEVGRVPRSRARSPGHSRAQAHICSSHWNREFTH